VTRVVSGAVLVVFAVAVVWFAPAVLFFIVAEVLLVLACHEYAGLARASELPIPVALSTAAAAVVCASFSAVVERWHLVIALDVVMMTAFLVIAVDAMHRWSGGRDAVAAASAAVLPLVYLGIPLGSMMALRELGGPEVLFLMMLTVIVSDSAQYYSGRAFGRHHLAPAISPKKTIEGAVGGLIFGALVLTVVGAWWLPAVPIVDRALLGLALVVAGIAGDLFESMLKRSAGVKDSSALIPGHGGILDRIDALLFAAPVYYIVLKYV
jgi:phosphatidate cytidylyltransferase